MSSPVTAPTPHPAAHRAARPYGAACRSSQLRAAAGPPVSEAAQQITLIFEMRNVSAAGCDIRGHPGIALADANGRILRFTYQRRGDEMLTGGRPELVPLAPGTAAYTAINKTPCPHAASVARRISIWPPGSQQPLVLTLPAYREIDYCGSPEAGHAIDVTPVEPTLAALYARH